MSLITIFGVNPFEGQKDPYITLDSSVSYNDGPQGTIENSYSLNGVLTGCSVQELMDRRDALVESFDWKKNTGIIENISIEGVVSASPTAKILPNSLSFESSTYIGALPYSLSLNIFTGFGVESDSEDLINKTHTESTSMREDGCITRTVNIGCEPNSNLEHCNAIEKANQWISGRMGITKLGEIEMQSVYELQTESLDINPISSALSYSRTESNCKDGANTADAGLTGLHFAYCIESDTNQAACPVESQEVTQTYQGEVYDTGKSIAELASEIKTRLFPTMVGVKDFNATYNEGRSNITFRASKMVDGSGNPIAIPQDLTVNNYTLSTSTDFNTKDGAVTVGSVNGRVYIENPVQKKPLDVNTEFDPTQMIAVAKGVCDGPTTLTQQNVSYDDIRGGINYSYGFSPSQTPDEDVPTLEGISGLSQWNISFGPPLTEFQLIQSLNCPDFIFDLGYAKRGSINVSTTATSGSGYDFKAVAENRGRDLVNEMTKGRDELQVAVDKLDVNGEVATYNYQATFKGASVISGPQGNIIGDLF